MPQGTGAYTHPSWVTGIVLPTNCLRAATALAGSEQLTSRIGIKPKHDYLPSTTNSFRTEVAKRPQNDQKPSVYYAAHVYAEHVTKTCERVAARNLARNLVGAVECGQSNVTHS